MAISYTAKTLAATTVTGNSRDYTNKLAQKGLLVVTITGSPTGTTPTATVKVQGKNSDGTYYDLPSSTTSALNSAGQTIVSLAYIPKRFRVVWTIGGTTPSIVLGVGIDIA
jgi:hypothetical protein